MERLDRRRGPDRGLTPISILDRLERAFATYRPALAERDPPYSEAAVALTLVPRGDDADLLLLRRATRASDPWSAQVALPGGRHDAEDATLLDTAIREAREETALDLSSARVLGALDELRPRIVHLPSIIVRPYVMVVTERPDVTPNDEVAELFWAPVSELFDPARVLRTTVAARGMQMVVDAIHFEGRVIWGMTERILRTFGRVLESE